MPEGDLHGYASSGIRFLFLISAGSMPSFAAAWSTMCSATATAIGCPTARYWHIMFLFWNTTVPLARYSLCLYGPPVRFRIWLHSTPEERGNIEYGPTPVRS